MSLSVRRSSYVATALLGLVCLLAFAGAPASLIAQQPQDLYKSIVFREIGPTTQGGRFVDIAVVEATPRIFYGAVATGGIWKTENHGMTFTSVFDTNGGSGSIGAVAVSQSNPNVVYVGTGEGNNSRSVLWGDGVYVSTDAGSTWANMGLKDSQHIGRIVVHPTDPNTAYVAALGHLYSPNEMRGLYKTTDGGKSWTKSLAVKAEGHDVGVVDVVMDPKNPMVLYAAAYDKVRKPWTFGEGGPGSGLYKTTDAGKTWTKLTTGLPVGWMGRIGVSIYRQDPNVVYAIIENLGMLDDARKARFLEGFGTVPGSPPELYRSDDAGKTWRLVAPPPAPPAPAGAAAGGGGGRGGGFNGGNPPYYYGQVRVDPNDKDHVYLLSDGSTQTRDGGKAWISGGMGGDSHALWIDPKDSLHMINGYDHGIRFTFDGGQSWTRPDNLPHAQFYAVGYDMETPYNVYGGIQDNGCQKGPSTRKGGGNIPFEDWTSVGCADGFYNEVDWRDSRWLYNESQFGAIARIDQRTGQSANIAGNRPPFEGGYRWNWSAPILVSPHNSDVVFHGAQVLLRSPFRGDTWQVISPDLTVNDPAKRGGGGNVTYATISTIDESPVVPGLIWAGTDDGNVQVTRDGGGTWTNVRDKIPGHPGYWVSRVAASHAAPGTAYVTITGFRNDDFKPFIWKTTDFGQTWTSIAGNLPQEAINVVRESPRNSNVLFVGTDLGVYVTTDGGKSWSKMRGAVPAGGGGRGGRGGGFGAGGGAPAGPPSPARARGLLPTVSVHDMKIHPRDRELIVATHGRGIFIADISEIEELTPAVLASDAYLFDVDPVIDWESTQRTSVAGANYAGMSRPSDMAIGYYLKSDASGDVKVRLYKGSRMLAELDGTRTAGINTVMWDLQARRDRIEGEAVAGRGGRAGGGGGGGGGRAGGGGAGAAGGGGGTQPPVMTPVEPGDYRVVLAVGGREYEKLGRVVKDPSAR